METEQQKKKSYFLSMLTVGLLMLLLLACLLLGVAGNALKDLGILHSEETPAQAAESRTVEIDWQERYPFETGDAGETETANADTVSAETSSESSFTERMTLLKNAISNSKTKMIGYQRFRELRAFVCKLCNNNAFWGKWMVELKNGYLCNYNGRYDEEALDECLDAMAEFADWCDSKEVSFLYVQAPFKNSKYDSLYPDSVADYSNENMDRVVSGLQSRGVMTLDLREEIQKDGMDHYSLFFATDHHWTMEGGLWAAGAISEKLNEEYGLNLDTDLLQRDRFSENVYEKQFLGSLGKTATLGYIGPDDFVIEEPDFATDFEVIIPDKELDVTGDFAETMFNDDIVEWKDYYNNSVYEGILWGNRPLIRILNKNTDNQLKVLILRDSFASAAVPYLALECAEVDLIDLREDCGGFDGSVKTFIETEKPDLVICFYYEVGRETFKIQ